jgi:aspartyl-tRNA(Asn)/glutamyl-tRNA(Gln) amidotransferase subunit B
MYEGSFTITVPGEGEVTIGLERLHLEEDAAKNIHGADERTYVDFNRGGTPLCEIVTKPDFRSAAQAKAYLHELRTLVRTLGVSNGDMEKGHMRCDVNISMREVDENGVPLSDRLHPKN